MKNTLYLQRKLKVMINDGGHVAPLEYIATVLQNIESLGFTLAPEVIEGLKTYSVKELNEFYLETVATLKKMVGAHVRYRPMYPNFPAQVMDASLGELYINAILHYWSFGQILPEYEKEERLPLWEPTKLKVIHRGTRDEFFSIFIRLMKSKIALSPADKDDLAWFINAHAKSLKSFIPVDIPNKENMAFIIGMLLTNPQINAENLLKIKTATDVLRLAVAMSQGDASLAAPTHFRSFKRKERRLLLSLLNSCPSLEEDMVRYKGYWLRLGERLHPSEYKTQYLRAQIAFSKLRNNEKIETFNKQVTREIDQKNLTAALHLLKKRPGELARKLDYLLRTFDATAVLEAFAEVSSSLPTPMLLQIKEHYICRNTPAELRTFFPKGSVTKVYGLENTLPRLNEADRLRAVQICEKALREQFKIREPLGKVYLDERLMNYMVPFAQRSTSKALKTLVRGTRLPIPENAKILRGFIYWKDGKFAADIDLSAAFFDANWQLKDQIGYYNLRSDNLSSTVHSGDITKAPYGASEFIDIPRDTVFKQGIRYVMFIMNSYTEQSFDELPECFMGWMARGNAQSGEIYEPKTVENKVDVASHSKICIPMIFDLEENTVIWTDIALKKQPKFVNNLEANKKGVALMGRAMTNLVKPNLYDLFYLHAESRGELCETPEEADVIFSIEEGITPFDTEIIVSEYL